MCYIFAMSGHNKWSKIKHKKGATDAKRSKVFSKHSRLIALESKKSGGDKTALGVRAAVERAKADSMPNDTIERAILKGAGADSEALEEIVYEAYGPAGVALMIATLSDNRNRTSQEVKHALSKLGYQLGTPGSASWAFIKKDGGYAPITPTALSDSDGEKLALLIETLEEYADVQDIYTSADGEEHA